MLLAVTSVEFDQTLAVCVRSLPIVVLERVSQPFLLRRVQGAGATIIVDWLLLRLLHLADFLALVHVFIAKLDSAFLQVNLPLDRLLGCRAIVAVVAMEA